MPQSNNFLKSNRLLNKGDFQNLRIGSRFLVSGVLLFYYKKTNSSQSRVGIAVTKKFGCASKRNRIKRKVREYFRSSSSKANGYDILVAINSKKIKKEKLDFKHVDSQVYDSLHKAFELKLF